MPAKGGWADTDCFVGQKHMFLIAVRGGVDSNRTYAELATRSLDSERDLATVGNDDLVEHGLWRLRCADYPVRRER